MQGGLTPEQEELLAELRAVVTERDRLLRRRDELIADPVANGIDRDLLAKEADLSKPRIFQIRAARKK